MKTEDVIYKVLQVLDENMDKDELDITQLTPKALGISKERRSYIIEMMRDHGLVKNVDIEDGGKGRASTVIIKDMKITLPGIMFLAENSTVNKVIKAAKLLKDTIPGI